MRDSMFIKKCQSILRITLVCSITDESFELGNDISSPLMSIWLGSSVLNAWRLEIVIYRIATELIL